MKLRSIYCPYCGAHLGVEYGIDTHFCEYCGRKISLNGHNKERCEAKMRMRNMEYKERMREKRDAQERYRMKVERKSERGSLAVFLVFFGMIFALILIVITVGNASVDRQEQELQATVDQIIVDIENEDFADAYIKANSLYWDDSWTSEGKEKWDATRTEIIKQIEKAEKEATDSPDEGGGFWNWFG